MGIFFFYANFFRNAARAKMRAGCIQNIVLKSSSSTLGVSGKWFSNITSLKAVAYTGILFGGGSTNSVEDR